MTWFPRSPGSILVLLLNQETVFDFILPFLPPCSPHLTPLATGSLNQSYLSSPHLEASPATTFRACSSPAPTPDKLQPAPAILCQESVHTMLSITHHTRKRPSTGPRTAHGPHYETYFLMMFNYWLFLLIIIRSVMKVVGAYVFFRSAK
jgi:hypothetical protein